MIPLEKVRTLVVKYDALEKELSTGTIDTSTFAQKSKEYSELGNIISYAREYLKFDNDQKDLEQMLKDKNSDSEMITLAEKEIAELKKKETTTQVNSKSSYFFNKLSVNLRPQVRYGNIPSGLVRRYLLIPY